MQIDGFFNTSDEPALKLNLVSSSIEVLVDTGFAGSLIIPSSLSKNLSLQFEGFEEFYTATAQHFVAPAYSVEIDWFAHRIRVPIAVSSDIGEALLGNQMLRDCRLTIDYPNRALTVTKD